jgi:hypothetical protein
LDQRFQGSAFSSNLPSVAGATASMAVPRTGREEHVAELTDDQKTKLVAVKAKVEAGDDLAADDLAFLEEAHEALEGTPAEEQESD